MIEHIPEVRHHINKEFRKALPDGEYVRRMKPYVNNIFTTAVSKAVRLSIDQTYSDAVELFAPYVEDKQLHESLALAVSVSGWHVSDKHISNFLVTSEYHRINPTWTADLNVYSIPAESFRLELGEAQKDIRAYLFAAEAGDLDTVINLVKRVDYEYTHQKAFLMAVDKHHVNKDYDKDYENVVLAITHFKPEVQTFCNDRLQQAANAKDLQAASRLLPFVQQGYLSQHPDIVRWLQRDVTAFGIALSAANKGDISKFSAPVINQISRGVSPFRDNTHAHGPAVVLRSVDQSAVNSKLITALQQGRIQDAKDLVNGENTRKADPRANDVDGKSALYWARQLRDDDQKKEMVEFLETAIAERKAAESRASARD